MGNSAHIMEQDGVLTGPMRQPRNLHQQAQGSIHNDAVAAKLGFRGGTVAGIIHHEQFAPLLVAAFGKEWFETGGISCYYLNASTNEENVQASVARPRERGDQVDIWIEHENGLRVLEGTAWVGEPKGPTYLQRKFDQRREAGNTRILEKVEIGKTMPARTMKVPREMQDERLQVATEVLDWYRDESPWGPPVCTPVTMFRLLNGGLNLQGMLSSKAVGLYGAIEVNLKKGPLFVEQDYEVQGRLLAKGETPKSEYLWWSSELRKDGELKATMLMMNRWMKASSELYQ